MWGNTLIAHTAMVLLLTVALSEASSSHVGSPYVTPEDINQVVQPAFRKLKLRKEWSCIKRLRYEKEYDIMEIWSGRITGIKDQGQSLKLLAPSLSFSLARMEYPGELASATISFKFPENVILQFLFKYTNKKGVSYTRNGKVTFSVAAVSVDIPVTLPKQQAVMKEKEEVFLEECQYKISPDDIVTKGYENLDILVEYRSAVGLQHSKKTMVQLFEEMKPSILDEYHAYVEMYVANVVNFIKWNCLDERAAEKWKLVNNDNCQPFPATVAAGKEKPATRKK